MGPPAPWHHGAQEVVKAMKRTMAVLGLAALVVGRALPGAAAELQPLMAGWERVFSVDWQPGQYRGKPSIEGYLNNISPYSMSNIRIMVESLDTGGQVTNQQIAWVPGDLLGGGRLFFQVPTAPAPNYRVRVFSYDRVELDGNFR
jgi:hypothetical protein